MDYLIIYEEYRSKLSTEQFIERSKKEHNNKYDYSKVNYINDRTPVEIICKKHGSFWKRPDAHIHQRQGCPKSECSGKGLKNIKDNKDKFIKKSNSIHGKRYDYSFVDYKGTNIPVKIICPTHGIFYQSPYNHLSGQMCKNCSLEKRKTTTESFIKRASEIYGDKYDYSKLKYIDSNTPVEIICRKHKRPFFPRPGDFLFRKSRNLTGCPICSESKGENMVSNILKRYKFNFESQKKFSDLKNLRFDFYLPKQKGYLTDICIEYDGEDHYHSFLRFTNDTKENSEKRFKDTKRRDRIKNKYCKYNNIWLIRIPYTEKDIDDIEEYLVDIGFLHDS